MKPLTCFVALSFALAFALAFAAPSAVLADTVYYSPKGAHKIEAVTGTIVQDTGSVVEITTADGRTISIPKADVYQIVREKPTEEDNSIEAWSSIEDVDSTPAASGSGRVHHFGFKGGMNFSNMSVDPQELEDQDSLQSFAVGGWWGTPLNRRLTLLAEALYSVKGDSETGGGYTATTRLSYIDVPVLAKIGFMHGSPAQPSLFLGPSMALNISANAKLESDAGDLDVDVKDQVNTLDFGLVVGGGVDFPLGKHTCGVELRYSKGLTNAAGESANGTAHHDVLAVMGSIGLQ